MKISLFYVVILILLILVWLARKSNNDDIVKKNAKSATDTANVKNARKVYNKTKVSQIFLIIPIIIAIIIAICAFTEIDVSIANYFSANIIREINVNYNLFFVPAYMLVARLIIIEVNVGDFALKYFKVKEEEPEFKIDIKSILYKKPKPTTEQQTAIQPQEVTETTQEEVPKEETKDTQ